MRDVDVGQGPSYRGHIEPFVAAFVPTHRQPRWLSVLAGNREKWRQLSMDDVIGNCPRCLSVNINDVLRGDYGFLDGTTDALMIRLSAPPGVFEGTLEELVTALYDADAIISVVPGQVALVVHHSGDWALCRSAKPRMVKGKRSR